MKNEEYIIYIIPIYKNTKNRKTTESQCNIIRDS